jgi:hypothetical protein
VQVRRVIHVALDALLACGWRRFVLDWLECEAVLSAHVCHIYQCGKPVPPSKLMCPAHWRMVPPSLQAAVLRTYRTGQCGDRKVSKEWLVAARAAINSVALPGRRDSQNGGGEG